MKGHVNSQEDNEKQKFNMLTMADWNGQLCKMQVREFFGTNPSQPWTDWEAVGKPLQ